MSKTVSAPGRIVNANQKNHHFAGEQPARLFAFPELVSVAQRCISFPSLSGREEELIKYLIRVASRLNFSSVGTDRMGNLIAEAKIGNGRGPKIVLTGHTDVVNADTSSWNPETRPWTGSIREGRLYGRGAVDMKSSLVAMLFAVGGLSLLPEGCNGKIEVIGYGPGGEEDAHTVDESIRLSELETAYHGFRSICRNLLRTE